MAGQSRGIGLSGYTSASKGGIFHPILEYYTLILFVVPGFLLSQLACKKSMLCSGVYSKLG